MIKSMVQKAMARQQRAWLEAKNIYSLRTKKQVKKITAVGEEREKAAKSLASVFESLPDSKCSSCGRCCETAIFDSGYYSHSERELLLSKGFVWTDYIVKQEEEEETSRCFFLSKTGCNIPTEFKSTTCLSYVCRDRLGPQLVQLGLEKRHKKAHKNFLQADEKLYNLDKPMYQEKIKDFGG